MILTGSEIIKEYRKGNIVISPFYRQQVNPNSYNYRLGIKLKVFTDFDGEKSYFKEIEIPKKGYCLKPKQMYLGHTFEIIGSKRYTMSLIGRSSMGRLGLFLQLSANLGHTTSVHRWTLEIMAVRPFIVYPKMIIGQVSFWENWGKVNQYFGKYGNYNNPQEYLY